MEYTPKCTRPANFFAKICDGFVSLINGVVDKGPFLTVALDDFDMKLT